MIGMSREDAEQALARALARHIGYTSGAYELRRIFSVVDLFKQQTSVYAEEIVAYLATQQRDKTLSKAYLADVLSFASSLGIVETVSSRDSKLSRYAATELGRSVLGVMALQDVDFWSFYATVIVVLSDADYLVPIMLHKHRQVDIPLSEYFTEFVECLRKRRLTWMKRAFPHPILFERVASRVPWLKRNRGTGTAYKIEVPTANTVRHHSLPRLGWLTELGLLESERAKLTPFGVNLLGALVQGQSYFWVGPNPDALKTLALSDKLESATEVDLRLNEYKHHPSDAEMDELIHDVGLIMKKAFNSAKLIHADQASLHLPMAYIEYRSYKDLRNYSVSEVIKRVFDCNRNSLYRLSAHKGQIGFYKRVSNDG